MAGVKGRSGGPRANSGGTRPGAGRKAAIPAEISPEVAKVSPGDPLDPRPTLELVALGHIEVSPAQLKALVALLPYVHGKKGAASNKPAAPRPEDANPYAARRGPRLAANAGRAV